MSDQDQYDRDYEEERRRARQNRRRRREQEIRRAKLILALLTAGAAAAVVVLILALHPAHTASTELTASAASPLETVQADTQQEDEPAAEQEEEQQGDGTPSAEQIEADRAAKNYSAPVASFWPYYYFNETENTKTIPSLKEDDTILEAGQKSLAAVSSSEEGAAGKVSDIALNMADQFRKVHEAYSEIPSYAAVGEDCVASPYAIVVNADTGEITAGKRMYDRISPASMTKVLTLLVAVEQNGFTEDDPRLKDQYQLTTEIEEFAYVNGSSAVCWMPGDYATVEDLMYGTILPSGADAALALALYTSGTQEKFVSLMNQKLDDLGISDSAHFTNCVGLYDPDHYCTVYDMAVIMKAAMENDLCRKVLSEHVWTTIPTSANPDGITVSNWFLRRIEDRDCHGTVLCAKTGYVNQSGSCAVSYGVSADESSHYIVCTADAYSGWRCIYDHVALYDEYMK